MIWQLQSMELALGIKFEVITVDTLAKCIIGGDENTARDMGIAIRHCDIIREPMDARYRSCIMVARRRIAVHVAPTRLRQA